MCRGSADAERLGPSLHSDLMDLPVRSVASRSMVRSGRAVRFNALRISAVRYIYLIEQPTAGSLSRNTTALSPGATG